MKQYAVTLHSPRDLFYSSYTLAGLHELRHRGLVDLRYHFTDFDVYPPDFDLIDPLYRDTWNREDFVNSLALYTVKHLPSGRVCRMGVDMNDGADIFSRAFMSKCDLVFKRHYQTQYIAQLDAETQRKIHPGGLMYGVRSPHERGEMALYLGKIRNDLRRLDLRKLTNRKGLRRHLIKPMQKLQFEFARHRDTKTMNEYEQDCHTPTEAYLLFQTRAWSLQGNRSQKIHQINEDRASLIRKMRDRFGNRFRGGFVPDAYAREQYPDCLTPEVTDLRGYTRLIQQAAVVVYTQGLSDSPAWKLGEYLAAGKAIVAEPITAELPRPLVSGQELIFYQSEQDCLDQCARLLDAPAFRMTLACNAQVYYRAEVEPSARALRMLQIAVG